MRGPRPPRPLNGRHFGSPLDQFHDKLSGLYGSFGSSIGTSRVYACLAPSMSQPGHQRRRSIGLVRHEDAGPGSAWPMFGQARSPACVIQAGGRVSESGGCCV
jgi:hypothetical protein